MLRPSSRSLGRRSKSLVRTSAVFKFCTTCWRILFWKTPLSPPSHAVQIHMCEVAAVAVAISACSASRGGITAGEAMKRQLYDEGFVSCLKLTTWCTSGHFVVYRTKSLCLPQDREAIEERVSRANKAARESDHRHHRH